MRGLVAGFLVLLLSGASIAQQMRAGEKRCLIGAAQLIQPAPGLSVKSQKLEPLELLTAAQKSVAIRDVVSLSAIGDFNRKFPFLDESSLKEVLSWIDKGNYERTRAKVVGFMAKNMSRAYTVEIEISLLDVLAVSAFTCAINLDEVVLITPSGIVR